MAAMEEKEENFVPVEIRVHRGDTLPVKIYTVDGDLNAIVMRLKRDLVLRIAKENGTPYTSGYKMDHDAKNYGLMLANGTLLIHSHYLSEYFSSSDNNNNNKVNAFPREDVCDHCWHIKSNCRHIEGLYPYSDIATLVEYGHCDHCVVSYEQCKCTHGCKRTMDAKCYK